jgi:hypothetical protein
MSHFAYRLPLICLLISLATAAMEDSDIDDELEGCMDAFGWDDETV